MTDPVRIALIADRDERLLTHREMDGALELFPSWARGEWLASDDPRTGAVGAFDGVWIGPGSPYRDDAAVLAAIAHARVSGTALLGTCGGFQYVVMEFAHAVARLAPLHAELEPGAERPLIGRLSCSLIAERRPVTCVPGTALAEICGVEPFSGFHWCSYGLAEEFVPALEAAGMTIAARAPDAGVEAVELPGHPFLIATMFQPQVGASSGAALHPIIAAFLAAAARGR